MSIRLTNLFCLYLKNCYRYLHETSWGIDLNEKKCNAYEPYPCTAEIISYCPLSFLTLDLLAWVQRISTFVTCSIWFHHQRFPHCERTDAHFRSVYSDGKPRKSIHYPWREKESRTSDAKERKIPYKELKLHL